MFVHGSFKPMPVYDPKFAAENLRQAKFPLPSKVFLSGT